jgi:hypothetical protein
LWRSRWNVDWQGKPKFSEKTCPSTTFVHHKIPHDQTRGGYCIDLDARYFGGCMMLGLSVSHKEWITTSFSQDKTAAGKKATKGIFQNTPTSLYDITAGAFSCKNYPCNRSWRPIYSSRNSRSEQVLSGNSEFKIEDQLLSAPMMIATVMTTTLILNAYFAVVVFSRHMLGAVGPVHTAQKWGHCDCSGNSREYSLYL